MSKKRSEQATLGVVRRIVDRTGEVVKKLLIRVPLDLYIEKIAHHESRDTDGVFRARATPLFVESTSIFLAWRPGQGYLFSEERKDGRDSFYWSCSAPRLCEALDAQGIGFFASTPVEFAEDERGLLFMLPAEPPAAIQSSRVVGDIRRPALIAPRTKDRCEDL